MLPSVLQRLMKREREISVSQLDYARNVAKRLDEHRELVEALLHNTTFFEKNPWHLAHLATQDDYLMWLFYLRHNAWPCQETQEFSRYGYVRKRPEILGKCDHPEFLKIHQNLSVAKG